MYDFDREIDRRGTGSIKWDSQEEYGQKDGLLPFWIADTDFASRAGGIGGTTGSRTQNGCF